MKKILFIDSDEESSKKYGENLTSKGYKVEYARDGEEGLGKAKELNPNLIILEVDLPKLNGTSVLKSLKENVSTRNIPVVMLAAHENPEVRTEATKLGVTVYFEKSKTNNEMLIDWVRELIAVSDEMSDEMS